MPRIRRRRRQSGLSEDDRQFIAEGYSDFSGGDVNAGNVEAVWRTLTPERAAEIAAEFAVPVCWAQRRFGPPGPPKPSLRVVKGGR